MTIGKVDLKTEVILDLSQRFDLSQFLNSSLREKNKIHIITILAALLEGNYFKRL